MPRAKGKRLGHCWWQRRTEKGNSAYESSAFFCGASMRRTSAVDAFALQELFALEFAADLGSCASVVTA